MWKHIAFAIGLLAATGARAETYYELKCSEVAQHTNWSEHLVGWLNLENIYAGGEVLNFTQAEADAAAFRQTCAEHPDFRLPHAASLTFPNLDEVTVINLAAKTPSSSGEYAHFRCADMADYANWSAHVVGWLDLDYAQGRPRAFDFVKALKDAGKLRKACETFPDLWIHEAVKLSFPQVDGDDSWMDVTASIPTPRNTASN